MKLLLDQNISRRLVKNLDKIFPGTNHVYLLEMQKSADVEIWNFAIVTQDSDFYDRSLVFGYPPKIIWLRMGNTSTKNILSILKKQSENIISFEKDKILSCLQIY